MPQILSVILSVWFVLLLVWTVGTAVLVWLGMRGAWREMSAQASDTRSFFQFYLWGGNPADNMTTDPRGMWQYALRTEDDRARFRKWSWLVVALGIVAVPVIML